MLSMAVRGHTSARRCEQIEIECEYMLKLGVFCIALVIVMHNVRKLSCYLSRSETILSHPTPPGATELLQST